jgi:flagellar basal body L-ring protein FlgH
VKDAENVGDFVLILIISINIHAKKRNKKTVLTTTSNPTKLAAQPEHN